MMIIELTLLTDEGKPFILDNATCQVLINDLKNDTEVRISSQVRANKVISHVPTAETEGRFHAN